VLRRHALDRELQVLAVGIIDLGNAGAVVEHAAKRGRARLAVEHAAGRMRKRRGVDPTPRLGVGGTDPGEQADQADDDAAKHAAGSSRATQPNWYAYWPASRLIAFTSPRSWRTVPQSGPSHWAGRGRRPYRARCRHRA